MGWVGWGGSGFRAFEGVRHGCVKAAGRAETGVGEKREWSGEEKG